MKPRQKNTVATSTKTVRRIQKLMHVQKLGTLTGKALEQWRSAAQESQQVFEKAGQKDLLAEVVEVSGKLKAEINRRAELAQPTRQAA